MSITGTTRNWTPLAAFAADAVCIIAFCTLGRRNHAEALTPAGIAATAWPFLAGLAAAWVLHRAWRRPTAVRPTGVRVWMSTVVIGMGLRAGSGAGIAVSFIAVATAVTGVLLLGWRAAVAARGPRRRDRHRSRSGSSDRPTAA